MYILQLVCFWIIGILVLFRIPRPRASAHGMACPHLSIIIPARNEAENLPILLDSLKEAADLIDEIILVDDGSTDGTADIARERNITVVNPGEIPEEWHGKSWACWNGALRAVGDLFLFLDADTRLEKGGIKRLLDLRSSTGNILSLQPYHRMENLYERLSAFFNLVVMAGLGSFSVFGSRMVPIGGFGPCLLCGREEYFRSGGHRSVRSDIIEDLALIRAFVRSGCVPKLYGGKGTVSYRMYPGGPGELLEGWTRTMALGAGSIRPGFLIMVFLWIAGATGAAGVFLIELIHGFSVQPHTVAVYLAYAVQIFWMLRRIGNFGPLSALLYPCPLPSFIWYVSGPSFIPTLSDGFPGREGFSRQGEKPMLTPESSRQPLS